MKRGIVGTHYRTIPLNPETDSRVTAAKPVVQSAGEVTGEVGRLLSAMNGAMKRTDIQAAVGLKHEDHFRKVYLLPALSENLIEMTIPDKPNSRLQKYRLTVKGRQWLAAHGNTPAVPGGKA